MPPRPTPGALLPKQPEPVVLPPVLAIVPVKGITTAKSRLSHAINDRDRHALVHAMLADVLLNLRRCTMVARVVVVTDDREAGHRALAEGAEVVPDRGANSHSEAALRGIAAAAHPTDRVLLAPGDCPLVTVEALDELLRVRRPAVVVVPDRHGDGTNALLLNPPDAIEPAFGPGSHARHLAAAAAAGVSAATFEVPSLALDIDTPDDIAALRARLDQLRGHAPATRGVLAGIVW